MHKHPVEINWKNEQVLLRAAAVFSAVPGVLDGGERCEQLIRDFVESSEIFADEPYPQPTKVTIPLYKVEVPYSVDNRRPLTLAKLNGTATLMLRPDQEKSEALLFKICPHDLVPLTIEDVFEKEVERFNREAPSWLLLQSAQAA
jgi:hypothetical protein